MEITCPSSDGAGACTIFILVIFELLNLMTTVCNGGMHEMAKSGESAFSLSSNATFHDPTLSSLFSKPSKPARPTQAVPPTQLSKSQSEAPDEKAQPPLDESLEAPESDQASSNSLSTPLEDNAPSKPHPSPRSRSNISKRKRGDDDLEALYLQKLAEQETKERNPNWSKSSVSKGKQNQGDQESEQDDSEDDGSVDDRSDSGDDAVPVQSDDDATDQNPLPQHETLDPTSATRHSTDDEIDKAARTVFLANVSTTAIASKRHRKALTSHLSAFLSFLDVQSQPHKLLSLRFRSTPYSDPLPKRAAYATKSIMPATTPATNAYAVYSTVDAARHTARHLNGTMVLNRHLRADLVAHPARIDHRRCVFVGNLGFVDDERPMREAEIAEAERNGREEERERVKAKGKGRVGDVEEGLWRELGKCGTVESVRVVRDRKTRVGKGIAYVQFADEVGVERALLLDGKKFPPMLMRNLRVLRARKFKKTGDKGSGNPGAAKRISNRGASDAKPGKDQSLRTGIKKLRGRAGGANNLSDNYNRGRHHDFSAGANNITVAGKRVRPPESFVFEGHRAASGDDTRAIKRPKKTAANLGGGKKGKEKKGKPKTRSAKRGGEWKARGGKK